MIAIEKSLPEETKKNFRRCPGEKSCEMIKTSSLSLFFQINLIKNVGTNLKTGVSFFFVLSERREFVCSPKVEIFIL